MDFSEIDREDLRNLLAEIGRVHMPFGKFGPKDFPPRGVPIIDLPVEYLSWFKERGFPAGRLGELLAIVFDLKEAGADEIFQPLRRANRGRTPLRKGRLRTFEFDD